MNKRGMTLIELLIAVVIIGLLAAIAVNKIDAAMRMAKRSVLQSDLRHLMMAQEEYFETNGVYAKKVTDLSFNSSLDVELTMNSKANGMAYAARARIWDRPKVRCGVVVGGIPPLVQKKGKGKGKPEEGVIVCRRD